MVSNPRRRTALLDAAVEVLAAQGARGLTFRAVDTEAGVPVGTASNYFSGRDELLRQAAEYVFVRLSPPAEEYQPPPGEGLELLIAQMREITERARVDRAGYLALFELRLEAARRPDLRDFFTERFRVNLDNIIAGYETWQRRGDRVTPVLLYLAMTGLLLEDLTLPGVLAGEGDGDLVTRLVAAIAPE
ncbi:TetR/AcrR family transcriptional regulator [Stackebrandtia nassauensis]|uniref:Transcriptional regulator, TetR family n=1 Tax=Stackebrandtia nassauensis (strain DSM 44728 / CIP 108903 / NRRL B-16338 / NBRC 102104 / LLR-40K-21) TaxID=446470 RepID=D3PYZ9_STANL|nr:TetR/AcrR family transcriptional regulator [Stackebrandtia nassauensis]ADD45428.1 transcriptional regulator, TetR family [Stackebrandtia nassauensis DSM 44728]